MLTANKLEKIIELEDNLRSVYEAQVDAKAAELEASLAERDRLQAIVDKQLETISDLSGKAGANQRIEQQSRELANRADKLQQEVAELKKRVKTLQKDLAEERSENQRLTQFDPLKMKKNLDANKKKLAEKTAAADRLQKALGQAKTDKAALQRKVGELEARLAELEPAEPPEAPEAVEAPEAGEVREVREAARA